MASAPQTMYHSLSGRHSGRVSAREATIESPDDYQSMCLLSRSPSSQVSLTLYFFSYKHHNDQTMGCRNQSQISLSTVYNNDEEQKDFIKNELLPKEFYDKTLNTYVLVHGFLASWNSSPWMCHMKDTILNNTNANVIIVDWSKGAKPIMPLDYSSSVTEIQYVAHTISSFIQAVLDETQQKTAENYHLIGHSLGSHISGFIGYDLNGTVGRITALDPAGPCFSRMTIAASSSYQKSSSIYRRLSRDSAELVLALHTDASMFGLDENCAHFDVWVNGGYRQPGCPSSNIGQHVTDFIMGNYADSLDIDITCCHSFAHEMMDILQPLTNNLLNSVLPSRSTTNNNRPVDGSDQKALDYQEVCYPVAYECRSWSAFKAGECGFCKDKETECIFIGSLGLDEDELILVTDLASGTNTDKIAGDMSRPRSRREVAQGADASSEVANSNKAIDSLSELAEKVEKTSEAKHFIKSGAESPHCLYTYQVIVATARNSTLTKEELLLEDKRDLYLQIPLEQDGILTAVSANRLVRISHRVEHEAPAFARLTDTYLPSMADNYEIDLGKTEDSKVDYFTALLTFESVDPQSKDELCSSSSSAAKGNNKQLCRPFDAIQEARLWSPSSDRLESVRWVAINYMSGLNEIMRQRYTYMLGPNSTVTQAEAIDESIKPSIDDLSSQYSGDDSSSSFASTMMNPASLVQAAYQPVNCAMTSNSGSSKRNIECGNGEAEFEYSIGLRPINKR